MDCAVECTRYILICWSNTNSDHHGRFCAYAFGSIIGGVEGFRWWAMDIAGGRIATCIRVSCNTARVPLRILVQPGHGVTYLVDMKDIMVVTVKVNSGRTECGGALYPRGCRHRGEGRGWPPLKFPRASCAVGAIPITNGRYVA